MTAFWQEQPAMAQRLESVHQAMVRRVPRQGRFAVVLDELTANRGKMLRPALLILSAGLDHRREEADQLAAAVEFLHLASLVHDDIIDEADVRRGQPSVVARHGRAMALYTGDYLIYLAARCVAGLDPSLMRPDSLDFMGRLLEAEAGQLEERYVMDLDQTDYLRRIEAKTGLLFSLATGLGSALKGLRSEPVKTMQAAGLAFGIAFQLRDDLQDLEDPAGPDLRSGNYTLPVLLALQEDPGLADLLEQARSGQTSYEAVIRRVHATRGPARTRQLIAEHRERGGTILGAQLGEAEWSICQWMSERLYGGGHED